MKKGVFIIVFFSLVSIILFSFVTSLNDTGNGMVSLLILPSMLEIFIHQPANITYNLAGGCNGPFYLPLEVSDNFGAANWWYSLESLKTGQIVENMNFTPNTTIEVFRWQNRLTVYANDTTGFVVNKSVVFYVNSNNHNPILGQIPDNLYACEASNFQYLINATDCDEDSLTFSGSANPFFVFTPRTSETIVPAIGMFSTSEIFSLSLNKQHVNNNYSINAFVSDGFLGDSKNLNITVIEINNPPEFDDFISSSMPATVWTQGANNSFSRKFFINDVEDGNQDSGNLSFNISYSGSSLFSISDEGEVSYTGSTADLGNHNVIVCATDLGIPISRRHPEILNQCGQTGANETVCVNFQLTVTNQNRQPTITSYFPQNLTFISFSTDNLHFNLTKFDPDGTIPVTFWYVDNTLVEFDNNLTNIDDFNFVFGCGYSGKHRVRAEITDGELNDSITWNVTLVEIPCPPASSGSGGGGGGGGAGVGSQCSVQWACFDWNVCQNAERSLAIGTLTGEDYRIINEDCLASDWDGESCGFQIRQCFDANNCNRDNNKPAEIQACQFVINPSCSDGVKNCHDGSCEFLVDCGGPCGACATCTDGIQNQGEQGLDCGGPCPFDCPVEIAESVKFFRYFIGILILLLIIAAVLIYRVLKLRKKLNSPSGA